MKEMKEKMDKETFWKGVAMTLGIALVLLVMITLVISNNLNKKNDRLEKYVKNKDEAVDKVIKRNIDLINKLYKARIKLIDMEDNEAELNHLKATANILEATIVELKKQLELEATLKAEELKDLRRRVNEVFDYNDTPDPDIPEKEYPDISKSNYKYYDYNPSIEAYATPETFGDHIPEHIQVMKVPQHILKTTSRGYTSGHTN